MKQPEDVKTLELPIDAKRGRGRPAKAGALTQAERAKRYRENKKRNPVVKSDVTENKVLELSTKLALAKSDINAEREFTRQWFETAKRFERENDAFKRDIQQMRVQLDLVESERNAAFKAFSDLQAKTKSADIKSDASLELQSRFCALRDQNSTLCDLIKELRGSLTVCLQARTSKKRLPDGLAKSYVDLLKKSDA